MKRRQKKGAPLAPTGIEFNLPDFDCLTAIHLDLRDADLFLRLCHDVSPAPQWQAAALLDIAHQRLRSALEAFDHAHAEWNRRLQAKRRRRKPAHAKRPRKSK